ncbi:MAG: LysR family transcriptional regulator [Acidimicrobiia bacterium]
MELRHLDALIAVAEEGTFTAAADVLNTAQSNVSAQILQLEADLGAQLFSRGRSGAALTESGLVVLERARRIRRELEAMREDVASLRGLQVGEASIGVVGTASRWLAPALVDALHKVAPGVRFHITEAPSERLGELVLSHALAQAVVTEPVLDNRLQSEPLFDEELVGLAPLGLEIGAEPVSPERLAELRLVLPPPGNPLRQEVDQAVRARGLTLMTPVEVDAVRLIVDIVESGNGVSVLPATAVPTEARHLRVFRIEGMPRRRLALISARDARLSLADQAVRNALLALLADRRPLDNSDRSVEASILGGEEGASP